MVSHVNVISPRDIERIARMGLVLTTHTNAYLYKALETTASKLKPEQYDDIVPMNALREAGVTVSLATDNVPISLWYPIAQTVARKDYKTKRMFGEQQALSRMEALRAATANGAYLTFDEAKKGSLEAGQVCRPGRAERRSAHRRRRQDRRHDGADDHGRRQDRARDAELVRLRFSAGESRVIARPILDSVK